MGFQSKKEESRPHLLRAFIKSFYALAIAVLCIQNLQISIQLRSNDVSPFTHQSVTLQHEAPGKILQQESPKKALQEWDNKMQRSGGFYAHIKRRANPTGSFQNCTPTAVIGNHITATETHSSIESGVLTVTCKLYKYRLVAESFRKSGSIITGVLSAASSVQRRKVRRNV